MERLSSLFEVFSVLLLWTSFYNKKSKILKGVIISFLMVVIFGFTINLQPSISIFANYFLMLSLVLLIFKTDFYSSFITLSFCHIVIVFVEFMELLIVQTFFKEFTFLSLYRFLPLSAILLVFTALIQRSKHWNKIVLIINNYISKVNLRIRNLWIANALLYCFMINILWDYYPNFVVQNRLFFFIIFALIIVVNYFIYRADVFLTEKKEMEKYYLKYYPTMINIIEDINAKQHEYKNHLNTINGIIEVSDNNLKENLRSYIDSLNSNLDGVMLIKSDNIVLNAIIYSKLVAAKSLSINFTYSIDIREDIELADFELTEILSNLLNNAFEAVKNQSTKWVHLQVYNDVKLFIKVSNSSNTNELHDVSKLTKRGFSTRNKKRGYGLYNVKKILNYKNGQLSMIIDKDNTSFEVNISKEH